MFPPLHIPFQQGLCPCGDGSVESLSPFVVLSIGNQGRHIFIPFKKNYPGKQHNVYPSLLLSEQDPDISFQAAPFCAVLASILPVVEIQHKCCDWHCYLCYDYYYHSAFYGFRLQCFLKVVFIITGRCIYVVLSGPWAVIKILIWFDMEWATLSLLKSWTPSSL